MTTMQSLIEVLERIAPLDRAAEWDNVGLLVGERAAPVARAMLAIDCTDAVLDEAIDAGAGAIVAYHPPIFTGLKRFTPDGAGRIAYRAAQAGVALYSPHTALDAAPGGVNDWLVEACGGGAAEALEPYGERPGGEQCKVVTFAPAEAIDALRRGMAAAGAGRIGEYEQCAFELAGHGTFLGGDATNPAVGRKGRLERVAEVRFEMVAPMTALPAILAALRAAHPYEEPPIEVHALALRPQIDAGLGRLVHLARPCSAAALAERVKKALGVDALRLAAAPSGPKRIAVVGLCAGAGGSLVESAIASGAEAFLTGEMRHHDVLAAVAHGCTVLLPGHTNTERGYLKILVKRLRREVEGVEFVVSRRDRTPWKTV